MSRICALTGKKVLFGNNVSHANNKTRRRFLPNLQKTSVYSEGLGMMVRLRMSTHALRCIDHKGGLDAFLLSQRSADLNPKARTFKKRLQKKLQQKNISSTETPPPTEESTLLEGVEESSSEGVEKVAKPTKVRMLKKRLQKKRQQKNIVSVGEGSSEGVETSSPES